MSAARTLRPEDHGAAGDERQVGAGRSGDGQASCPRRDLRKTLSASTMGPVPVLEGATVKRPSVNGLPAPRVSKRAAQPYPAFTRRRLGADQPAGECALPKMPRGWPGDGGVAKKEAAKQAGQKGLYGGHGLFNPRQPCIFPPAARRGSARRKPFAPRVSARGRPSPAPRRRGRGHGLVPHRR